MSKRAQKPKSELRIFVEILNSMGGIVRKPFRKFLVPGKMKGFAEETIKRKNAEPKESLEDMALEYQRMFPSKKLYELENVTEEKAHFKIHAECPLKNSQDAKACLRLMEYDNALANHIGADFENLESQALTGNSYCKIALRKQGN